MRILDVDAPVLWFKLPLFFVLSLSGNCLMLSPAAGEQYA